MDSQHEAYIQSFYQMLSAEDRASLDAFVSKLNTGASIVIDINSIEYMYLGNLSDETNKELSSLPEYMSTIVVRLQGDRVAISEGEVNQELKKELTTFEVGESSYIVCSCGYDQFYGRKDGKLECACCGNLIGIPSGV